MKSLWLHVAAIGSLSLVGAISANGDILIGVQPPFQSVGLGATIDLEISIAWLTDPPSLGTFDLNLNFDPTIVSFNSASFGDPVLGEQLDPTGGGNTIDFVTPGVGTVELFDLSLDSDTDLNSLQPPNFILATVTFDAIGVGTSALDLTINALGDADGNSLAADIQGGSVEISAVPEPESVSLFIAGLMAIQIRRSYAPRKQKARQDCHAVYPSLARLMRTS